MPFLVKGLLIALRSAAGRKLLLAAAVGVVEVARSDRARAAYAKARELATDPEVRRAVRKHAAAAAEGARKAARRP